MISIETSNQTWRIFHTADYPKQHVLHSPMNKKVIGKFKDETSSCPIRELVGLRPKMYSFFLKEDGKEKKEDSRGGEELHDGAWNPACWL